MINGGDDCENGSYDTCGISNMAKVRGISSSP